MCFVGFLFFFSKEISKLCQTHLDQRPQQERRGRDREGREREGGRDHSTSWEKERNSNTFVWKPQAKNAFIRTQATEPDSNSSLYRNIQRSIPRDAPGTRTPRAHPRTPTRTQTQTDSKSEEKKPNQTLKTLQKKWNTSGVRINKNLHKTRHILWVRNGGKRKTRHWIPTENPTRTARTYLPPREKVNIVLLLEWVCHKTHSLV